jgi:hypothetical protein
MQLYRYHFCIRASRFCFACISLKTIAVDLYFLQIQKLAEFVVVSLQRQAHFLCVHLIKVDNQHGIYGAGGGVVCIRASKVVSAKGMHVCRPEDKGARDSKDMLRPPPRSIPCKLLTLIESSELVELIHEFYFQAIEAFKAAIFSVLDDNFCHGPCFRQIQLPPRIFFAGRM